MVKLLLKKIGGEVRDISLEDGILSISIMFKAFVELDKEL